MLDARTETFGLPAQFDHTFKIVAFDWDGAAVPSRTSDASDVTQAIENLLDQGVFVAIVTGTHIGNVFEQSLKHVTTPNKDKLFACMNRGSEVFTFEAGRTDPVTVHQRVATEIENKQLDQASETLKQRIEASSNMKIDIVYDRVNRRKVDINTLPEWADPPKSRIVELEESTQSRLKTAGFSQGMATLFEMTDDIVAEIGLAGACMTTDMKYLEVGLTDKGSSIKWVVENIARPNGIDPKDILIGGDEFGPLGEVTGSDYRMVVPEAAGATYFSVGREPNGVTEPVIFVGGGPDRFRDVLQAQAERHIGN